MVKNPSKFPHLIENDTWGSNTLFLLGTVNVHIKLTDMSFPQIFSHWPHRNTDKDFKIDRPPSGLWSFCSTSAYAAAGLWPESDFPTLAFSWCLLSCLVAHIYKQGVPVSIIHSFIFILPWPAFVESNHKCRSRGSGAEEPKQARHRTMNCCL